VAGNTKGRKRRFGSVRKLPSGSWQGRYTGTDGLYRNAPFTFGTKRAAEQWLVETEADMLKGEWLDPDAGTIKLDEYVSRWTKERDLKARTREEYERHIRLHVKPELGENADQPDQRPAHKNMEGEPPGRGSRKINRGQDLSHPSRDFRHRR
jgi:hypothetical protein